MLRDGKHKVSYIDVGNPIDVCRLTLNIQDYYPGEEENEKYRIKTMSSYLRDKLATAVYHMTARHMDSIMRNSYKNIERYFIDYYVNDTFKKLNWQHDVFDAEYLTKQNKIDKEYMEVIQTLSHLRLNKKVLKETALNNRMYVLMEEDLIRKDVVYNMQKRFYRK